MFYTWGVSGSPHVCIPPYIHTPPYICMPPGVYMPPYAPILFYASVCFLEALHVVGEYPLFKGIPIFIKGVNIVDVFFVVSFLLCIIMLLS